MSIAIRNKKELEIMREASRIVAVTLDYAKSIACEQMSLLELDKAIEDKIYSLNAIPSFKGLYGFPNAACLSLNEIVIHGIPTDYRLKKGDILGIDIGTKYQNYYGDGAITIGIGEVSAQDSKLMDCSLQTLQATIDSIKAGMRFKEISAILQENIESRGFVPLRDFCGHGIGTTPHAEPSIPNYLDDGVKISGPKIKNGMVFCLEPMVCQKSGEVRILPDKWSVVSIDGKRTSHHEHTIAIIDNRAEILTRI
ncbi:type I methionyl aminopeptidase [Helicobacter saguini]|uniref:Methionine aminopeptidase n=1 Tax=Helicobacter saguini TaxID=1548018 RepID=A0A099BC60_9HELI|nr:type I methionyl aminopeptidase [Helicobacter saguini]MWV60963.1 type I methionyl aminopeptidase [Helicobacter saguini]MWV68369.1 type I methionyl aminopeptidase [Helicobacter saguini]MWV70167.1 type I methionyl aminopeptidase [Helicobacter saguini]MWV72070.1 type I methionyl aminopeptidase [Helicobacter saguini]TLD93709.1 type I methionyl aminopeptidase [Helicobacter saguini]